MRVIGKGSFGKGILIPHKAEEKWYAVKVLNNQLVLSRNEAKHIMSTTTFPYVQLFLIARKTYIFISRVLSHNVEPLNAE